MYNIIIFGTGRTSRIIESGLNDFVNIVCYLDNDSQKWESIYNNRKILNPDNVINLNYDYIIIASQFNEPIYNQLLNIGVSRQKILQFYKYYATCNNHVKHKLQLLYQNSEEIEVIATGISYMVAAVKDEFLCKRLGNIANSSQDLYYDYNLVKHILEQKQNDFKRLNYLFIGLSYYSFQYDMSLSAMKGNVFLYNEVIGKEHNFKNIEILSKEKECEKKIGSLIFKMNSLNVPIFDWKDEKKDIDIDIKINEEIGKRQAIIDGNKHYPVTVKENIIIFQDYLKLLERYNIKPIMIVCPVSKYYSKHFPKELKEEFYKIIMKIKQNYNFQFIDYFNSDLFQNNDFYDVSHLNDKGAEKFTKILNNIIEW